MVQAWVDGQIDRFFDTINGAQRAVLCISTSKRVLRTPFAGRNSEKWSLNQLRLVYYICFRDDAPRFDDSY